MKRLILAIFVLGLIAACGKGGDQKTETASQDQKATEPAEGVPGAGTTPPVSMIPEGEGPSEFEKAANGKIRPYFDDKGTKTEIAVAPGDYFDLYVFGEYSELYPMSAAEWKLVLPENVSIMGQTHTDSVIVSMGKWDSDFMMAFQCTPGPKIQLVKYQCKAHEGFTGGKIETTTGDNLNFIGFTMCDATKTLIHGQGGVAELRVK